MEFKLKRPCKDCPFLKKKGYLRRDRAEAISAALRNDGSFSCHKTVDYSTDDISCRDRTGENFCAGAMAVMQNEDTLFANVIPRLGVILKDFEPNELRGHEDVYDSLDDFIDGHGHFERLLQSVAVSTEEE